jgi:putative membrane protein
MALGMRQDQLLRWLARWVAGTLSIYLVGAVLQGPIVVNDFAAAIWAGLALGLLNTFIRPVLVVFTLPATILTLGLFMLVINAFILLLVDSLVAGIEIAGFGWALLGALLISVFSAIITAVLDPTRRGVHIEIRR